MRIRFKNCWNELKTGNTWKGVLKERNKQDGSANEEDEGKIE